MTDDKAIHTVLRIIDRRIKLLGLGEPASAQLESHSPLVDPDYWRSNTWRP